MSDDRSGNDGAERDVHRMVNGLAARTRALRLLGNGVCPLAAAHAWRSLAAAHGLGPVDLGTAAVCDKWASESRAGGWSTHQVDANRNLANDLRRAALGATDA